MPIRLTRRAACSLILTAQGLHRRPEGTATKNSVLEAIRRMGVLQIDTINVVARSPYLVLWSRLGHYDPHWLNELLSDGALFEYWSHEACFLPIEDYSLYRHRMLEPRSLGWKYSQEWAVAHQKEIAQVLTGIRERGPLRSADFASNGKQKNGWGRWKPEKRALETLFTTGELMIARRHNFQRVYDLRERVLPTWDDTQLPPREELQRSLILKAVRALGVTTAAWVADYFRIRKQDTIPLVIQLAKEGALLTAQVEGWDNPVYLHPDHQESAEQAVDSTIRPQLTTLLSPFDPLVWDRERTRRLFNFDYTLECYTPAPKRRYGYFTLPILHRGALIGRVDAKTHRQDALFEVKAFHLEPDVRITDRLVTDVAQMLRACATWHGTPEDRDSPHRSAQARSSSARGYCTESSSIDNVRTQLDCKRRVTPGDITDRESPFWVQRKVVRQ